MESSRDYKLPTREQCYSFLEEYELPENIIKHIELVNKISVFLASRLSNAGIDIDIDMVDRASLLHDLDKMLTLRKPNHGDITEKILSEKGYPELGRIAKLHCSHYLKRDDLPWEAKIINYADKRSMHDNIVSVKKRFEDFKERYNVSEEEYDPELELLSLKLEKEIFDIIGMKPEELVNHI